MDYGEVLERAWRITWRFKGLWLLGILASCRGGSGGGGGGGGGNYSGSVGPEPGSAEFTQLERFLESVDPTLIVAAVAAVIGLLLLLTLVFLLLGVFGQTGLIHGADRADRGQAVTLAAAASGGLDSFLRLLGLELLLLAAFVVIFFSVIFALALFVIFTLGLGLLLLLPFFCVGLPLFMLLGVALQIYLQFVRTGIVVDSLPITNALESAWELVRARLAPAAIMGFILILGGWLVNLIISVPFFLLLIPLIAGVALGTETALGIGIGAAALCCLAYLPVMLLLNGVLQTYLQSAWTLTYRRLTGREGEDLAPAST